ncbi:MAG: sulfotransferase domain-containing protein [Pseudomonadota bacterium]
MLILNNGVPKSGSTMVQNLLRKAIKPKRPSEEWQNPDWTNPSILPEKIKPFMESEEYKKAQNVLLKMHFEMGPDFEFLCDNNEVKVVVSWRNVPDSVLSFFHHQIRRGRTQMEDKLNWLETRGRRFARRTIDHKKSWQSVRNCYLVQFESLLEGPDKEFSGILDFLEIHISDQERADILSDTIVQLSDGERPRDGSHIRTAGQSRAKLELPQSFYEEFEEMNKEIFSLA